MPNDPTPDELAKLQEVGRIIAPFLTVYIATQLAAVRYQGPSGMPSSESWRRGVLVESLRDAQILLEVI